MKSSLLVCASFLLASSGWASELATIPVVSPSAGSNATRQSSDAWLTLGAGAYAGQDYPRKEGQSEQSTDVGGLEANIALSYVSASRNSMLRLRAAKLLDFTSNSAEEVAFSAGLPLARKVWATVGISRLTDVADDRQRPTVGIPIEMLWFPLRGMEILIHANVNRHSNFIGLAIGGAIGRDRER